LVVVGHGFLADGWRVVEFGRPPSGPPRQTYARLAAPVLTARKGGGGPLRILNGRWMLEHVALKYSKINWRYTRQDISGGSAGNTAGGWDVSTNKIA
jgi:hypothetical protein